MGLGAAAGRADPISALVLAAVAVAFCTRWGVWLLTAGLTLPGRVLKLVGGLFDRTALRWAWQCRLLVLAIRASQQAAAAAGSAFARAVLPSWWQRRQLVRTIRASQQDATAAAAASTRGRSQASGRSASGRRQQPPAEQPVQPPAPKASPRGKQRGKRGKGRRQKPPPQQPSSSSSSARPDAEAQRVQSVEAEAQPPQGEPLELVQLDGVQSDPAGAAAGPAGPGGCVAAAEQPAAGGSCAGQGGAPDEGAGAQQASASPVAPGLQLEEGGGMPCEEEAAGMQPDGGSSSASLAAASSDSGADTAAPFEALALQAVLPAVRLWGHLHPCLYAPLLVKPSRGHSPGCSRQRSGQMPLLWH